MSGVVVLNTDNTALHTVSIKHAIKMLVREVAIVEEAHEERRIGPYPLRQDDVPLRQVTHLVQARRVAP